MTSSLDSQALRATMRQWVTGVTVVTSVFENEPSGMTVSSFTSVSVEPPTVLVCVNKQAYTHDIIARSGIYAISLLSAGQEDLSNRFAGLEAGVVDRFEDLEVITAETGAPLLPGAIAWLDCRVTMAVDTSTHTIYIAEVLYAKANADLEPLAYHNRHYRLLIDAPSPE